MNILDLKRKAQGWSFSGENRGGWAFSSPAPVVNTTDKFISTGGTGENRGGQAAKVTANPNYVAPLDNYQQLLKLGADPALVAQAKAADAQALANSNGSFGAYMGTANPALNAAENSIPHSAGQIFQFGHGNTNGTGEHAYLGNNSTTTGWSTPQSGSMFGGITGAIGDLVGGIGNAAAQSAKTAAQSTALPIMASILAPEFAPALTASLGAAGTAGLVSGGTNLLSGGNLDSALKAGVGSAALSGVGGWASSSASGMLPSGLSTDITGAAGNVASGVAKGAASAALNGGNIGQGIINGATNGAVGAAGNYAGNQVSDLTGSNALGGAASGAVVSDLTGGNLQNGVISGAINGETGINGLGQAVTSMTNQPAALPQQVAGFSSGTPKAQVPQSPVSANLGDLTSYFNAGAGTLKHNGA